MSSCISLAESTACRAFNASSISTDPSVAAIYPFLKYVSNVREFDEQITNYAYREYVSMKYGDLLGCSKLNVSHTDNYYARYTISVLCNGIVQNSKDICGLSNEQSTPLCADSCADSAISEELIAVNPQYCGTPRPGFIEQVRADFTNCALPADSLSGTCIRAQDNEPQECGFGKNLVGLCTFCATSTFNSTDSCCINSNVTGRCKGVDLPTVSHLPPLFTSGTAIPSASDAASEGSGLSGGQIAGIVIGAVIGTALLVLLALFLLLYWRRRSSNDNNLLNQPTPSRKGPPPPMATHSSSSAKRSFDPVPGGRVARMAALRDEDDTSSSRYHAARGPAAPTKYSDASDSEGFGSSPPPRSRRGPPVTTRRHGSLSSTSVLAVEGDSSPQSGLGGAQISSPEGVTSGQSEQLPYFRDYYSQDDIHPNDKVAVLWAYQPRAADEFELERGDMLKVIGIWDDGWATGVRLNERAEDFDPFHNSQRDSGVSNGSDRGITSSPPSGEIKAFPLVCVCLPQHWRKMIDGDAGKSGTSDS